MEGRHVVIEGSSRGSGILVVDGHDLSHLVSGFLLRGEAGGETSLLLTLNAVSVEFRGLVDEITTVNVP